MIDFVGDTVTRLLEPTDALRIGAVRSTGALRVRTADACAWLVVEGGDGALALGDRAMRVSGRSDVFDGAGCAALLGRNTNLSVEGDLRTTLVWRAFHGHLESRFIDPAGVADESRGSGATARRVRTYVAQGPLIVGETLNPPGGWSSWPPHSHDHEEIYLYRFRPAHGFGVHAALDENGPGPQIVRDGEIVRITHGEHPVVAAPGCAMYYLWALAGENDTVTTMTDPRFS